MKNLDLDYAVALKPYAIWFRALLLLAALLLAAGVARYYQQLQTQLQIKQATAENVIVQKPVASNPQLDETLNYAWATQQNLNFPWLKMLSALESVKAQHPNVDLLSVTPNRAKAEIMLTGEAKSFDEITQLLTDLKANPAFTDAVLVNQRLIEELQKGAKKGVLIYTFSLKLNWRTNLANMAYADDFRSI
jgi:Fimbrial assembly protein (PilN)